VATQPLKSCPQTRFLAILLAFGASSGCSDTPEKPADKRKESTLQKL
jgi:hypothetical protein